MVARVNRNIQRGQTETDNTDSIEKANKHANTTTTTTITMTEKKREKNIIVDGRLMPSQLCASYYWTIIYSVIVSKIESRKVLSAFGF